MVSLKQAVTYARLGGDGNAYLAQSGQVTVDRPDAQLKVIRHLLRRHDPPALQQKDQAQHSVHAVHTKSREVTRMPVDGQPIMRAVGTIEARRHREPATGDGRYLIPQYPLSPSFSERRIHPDSSRIAPVSLNYSPLL